MGRRNTIAEVKSLFKENDYKLLEDEYINNNKKMLAIDNEGYRIFLSRADVVQNVRARRFCKSNKYTIFNIKLLLKKLNCEVEILSNKYVATDKYLDFQCECGMVFKLSLAKLLVNKYICCEKCRHDKLKLVNLNREIIVNGDSIKRIDAIRNLFLQKGYTPLFNENDDMYGKLDCIDVDGYMYSLTLNALKLQRGKRFVHASNNYTINNIQRYMDLNKIPYKILSTNYKNEKIKLKFECDKGHIFKINWSNMMSSKSKYCCTECARKRMESIHANVLKQMFKTLKPKGTVLEDNSCINTTGYPLPTDIVNHEYKIAIEIQSSFHDNEAQKIKDKIKKDFWVNKGYSFYSPDIRDYSVIEIVQLFFPDTYEIPKWIDFDFTERLDLIKAQELIDKNYTLKEISHMMDVTYTTINNAVKSRHLELSDDYKSKCFRIRKVVRLDDNYNLIKIYDTFKDVETELNTCFEYVKKRCLDFKRCYYGGYWMYMSEYDEFIKNKIKD